MEALKVKNSSPLRLLLFLLGIVYYANAALYQQQQPAHGNLDQLQQPLQQQQHQQQQHQQTDQQQQPEPPPSHRSSDRDGPIFRYYGSVLNSTTVKLVWNLVHGHYPSHFDIEYGPIPDATNVFSVRKLEGTARDYTFHNLTPDTMYQFQLHGYNGDQAYKPQFVVIRTLPVNYVGKSHQDFVNKDLMPLGVKAEAKPNNSIQLSWTEPERPTNVRNSNRVNIIRYYVNPTLSTSLSNETTTDQAATVQPQYHYLNITNARESRLIVQKLKPATEYAFAVKTAYYSPDMKKIFVQSGFSMDTIAKTFDLEPSAPRNFNIQALPPTKEELKDGQTGKLELTWLAPESPNGQLKGYVILYAHEQNVPEKQWIRIEVDGANINNWYVANLRPGWSYYFKIRAINQRGQSGDSDTRLYVAPANPFQGNLHINTPIPQGNLLMLIVICMVAILFFLFIVVSRLACKTRRKPRKGSMNSGGGNQQKYLNNSSSNGSNVPKLNGFTATNSSSTVAARVGTLARRRDNSSQKPDFWISAMDQSQSDSKTNISEKSNNGGDMNMAMVSIQRDSPQFATTQLAPALPDYRFASSTDQQLLQQLQQQHQQQQPQSHYHPGQLVSNLAFDQMDSATASALMTLSKRQQQQMQKYQIQFANTGGPPPTLGPLASSPHQQPPPPPPLNIEQQQQQSLYGSVANTRSLRLHRPTLYDPVSGSFVQSTEAGPPNYNSHHINPIISTPSSMAPLFTSAANSNTLQFHPHQTSTLLSRRSTNTLRSFQTGNTYGQIGGNNFNNGNTSNQFSPAGSNGPAQQQPQQLLQSHQAVINQLNNSTYPSLPLKHVSAVRPQIMSSLEDQIEMELAEKEQQEQQHQSQLATIKQ